MNHSEATPQKIHPSVGDIHESHITEAPHRTFGQFWAGESSFSRIVIVSRTLKKDLVTLATFRTYIALVSFVHSRTKKCHSGRECFNSEEPVKEDFDELAVSGKLSAEHGTRSNRCQT